MNKHALQFFADDGTPRQVGFYGPFLRDLLDVLVDACQQAMRLRLEGRSIARGMTPRWLIDASAFEFYPNETEIVLKAPPIREQLAWKTWQSRSMFPIDASLSCLDIMEESLEDALQGRVESDRYDRHLIATMEAFGQLSRYNIGHIDLINGRTLRLDRKSFDTMKRLRTQIPEDRRVIIAGKLETIRHSDRAFGLLLDSGDLLKGIAAESVAPAELGALFGQKAMISGIAKFRPSGKVLHVEAEHIEAADGDVSIWSAMPKPLDAPSEHELIRTHRAAPWSFADVFGRIQMDESDEEFHRALEELS